MAQPQTEGRGIGERLQSLPKPVLYLVLLMATAIPLFFKVPLPNDPGEDSIDLYQALMKLPEGSRILIESDWTNSTRGESRAHFEALLRILIRKNIKAAIYATADPQAPQVARDVITSINVERKRRGEKTWDRWNDWVTVGFFPNAETALNGMGNNLRTAWAGKKDTQPGVGPTDVFRSPVLQGINRVQDSPLLVVITASKTSNFAVERLSGKIPLAFMVTGVMGPETRVFYQSKQIIGMVAGLKGAYDMETLMEKDFPGQPNAGQGTKFYLSLHIALALLILTVIVGNVGMLLSRRRGAR